MTDSAGEPIPSLSEVKTMARHGNVVPIYREVRADLETPVSAYLKIVRGDFAFLLESVEGGERVGRYSLIGAEPYRVLSCYPNDGDPLTTIQEELAQFQAVEVPGLPRFHGGAVGYLGYEVAGHFEQLPTPERDTLEVPESWLMFTDTLLVFDHLLHTIKVVAHARLDGDVNSSYREAKDKIDELVTRLQQPLTNLPYTPVDEPIAQTAKSNWKRNEYLEAVERCRRYVHDGDVIQVVLSQRFSRATGAHPFEVYRSLRTINPSPYMYFLKFQDTYLVGASPELLVNIQGGLVEVHPIAGTRPRGSGAIEDSRLSDELRSDPKELAEHVMLLDLGRNDVGRVSKPGTVKVTQQFDIEYYSHVMHLVSHVQGQLRDDMTPYDALRSAFPAGTVTGAPKIRAMQIVAELEPDRRGPYSGAVGFFDMSGNIETAITIRTALMKDGWAHIQSGGGIVFDSDPITEFEETEHKARAMLAAIDDAERNKISG